MLHIDFQQIIPCTLAVFNTLGLKAAGLPLMPKFSPCRELSSTYSLDFRSDQQTFKMHVWKSTVEVLDLVDRGKMRTFCDFQQFAIKV